MAIFDRLSTFQTLFFMIACIPHLSLPRSRCPHNSYAARCSSQAVALARFRSTSQVRPCACCEDPELSREPSKPDQTDGFDFMHGQSLLAQVRSTPPLQSSGYRDPGRFRLFDNEDGSSPRWHEWLAEQLAWGITVHKKYIRAHPFIRRRRCLYHGHRSLDH